MQLLDKFGVRTITNCADLATLTVKAAKVSGRIVTGGSLLAVYEDCMLEQYDDSITCYGPLQPGESQYKNDMGVYSCYDESSKGVPFESLGKYLDTATASIPSSQGLLWMAQVTFASLCAIETRVMCVCNVCFE